MHVTIVTAFPEFFRDFLSTSIVGRAVKRNLLRVDLVDLREIQKQQEYPLILQNS